MTLQKISMDLSANFLQIGSVATVGVDVEGGSQQAEIVSIEAFIEERTAFRGLNGANCTRTSALTSLVRLLDKSIDARIPWSSRRIVRMPCDGVLRPSTRTSNKDKLATVEHKIVVEVAYRRAGQRSLETCSIEKAIYISSVRMADILRKTRDSVLTSLNLFSAYVLPRALSCQSTRLSS